MIDKKGLTMQNPMADFENFDGFSWFLTMGVQDGFVGLYSYLVDFQVLQTKTGNIDDVVKEGLFLQEQIKKKQREFQKFINVIKRDNDNLRVLGDIDYLDKITKEVQNFKQLLEE